MIRFSCRCGHVFEEPDDCAGAAVQCPDCHLLNDVPTLSDRESIGLDGTYAVNPHASRPAPDQLEDTPETGELIQAIPVAREADDPPAREPIPLAKAVVTYEAFGAVKARSFAEVLLDLVRPLNLLVLFFVLLAHLCLLASLAALSMGLFIILPILAALVVTILAHFANAIDEIGVEGQNELPRLLRDLRMHEDILWPFARVITATVICFAPPAAAMFLPVEMSFASSLAVVLAMGGIIFFPAVLLTLQTSGSVANLRPDRVLAVIRQAGRKYISAVITFAVAAIPYVYGMVSLALQVMEVGPFSIRTPDWAAKPALDLPLICIGIFMMHAFCWDLGLIYRVDGEQFPWVGRYHVREKRPPVARRKPRYVRG